MKNIVALLISTLLIGCVSTEAEIEKQERMNEVHVYYGGATAAVETSGYKKGVTYPLIGYVKKKVDDEYNGNDIMDKLSTLDGWSNPYLDKVAKMKPYDQLTEQWQLDVHRKVMKEGYLINVYTGGYEVHVYHGTATANTDMPRYEKNLTYSMILYVRESIGTEFNDEKAMNMLSKLEGWSYPKIINKEKIESLYDLNEPHHIEDYEESIREGYLVIIYDDVI